MVSAKVVFVDATGSQSVLWQSDVVLIGRDSSCGVHIDHPMVSRRHCRLTLRDGRWLLEDLGTANGTYVNQQRVQGPVWLNHLDQIRCGPLQFQPQGQAPLPTLQFQLVADEGGETYVLGKGQSGGPQILAAAREEVQRLQAQLDEAGRALAEERRRGAAQVAERQILEADKQALQVQVSAAREDQRVQAEAALRADRRREDCERRARAIQDNLDQQGQEAARLRQELEDKKQELAGLAKARREQDEKLAQLRELLALEQRRVSELRQTTAAREEADRELQRKELELHKVRLQEAQRKREELEKDLQAKAAESARIGARSQELAQLQARQDERQRELEAQLRQLRQQATERDERVEKESKEAARLLELNSSKNTELRGLRTLANDLEEKLKKREADAEREQLRAQRRERELTERLDALRAQVARAGLPQAPDAAREHAQGVAAQVAHEVGAALAALREELGQLRRLLPDGAVSSAELNLDDPLAGALARALGQLVDAQSSLAQLRTVGGVGGAP